MSFPSIPKGSTPDLIAQTVNRINRGKFNATTDVTLAANAASTVVVDERLSVDSALVFDPMTANAAAEVLFVTAANRGNGSCTITHTNAASTDRTFRLLIIG